MTTISKKLFTILFFSVSLFCHSQTSDNQYQASWESVESHPYPKWFSDAKLGIFIHWGVYSVPSWSGKEQYSEWFLRGLQLNDGPRVAFQQRVYGSNFTYRDYAPLFKAELFDANEWAELFEQSGAKYVTLVSKHHDGFCLWPSKYAPNWNSWDVGSKRDLVGELSKAVRERGLKMGLYYSLTEWNNPLHRWYTDASSTIGNYVEQHMIPQFKELVGTYKPSLIFADGEWLNKADDFHTTELLSWYYNLVGEEAIVNNRWGGGSNIGFLTPEYSSGLDITDRPWTEVRGLGRSFGLNRNEKLDAYMTSDELIQLLVKSVAHGGGLLINIGPGADGQIPLLQQERLLEMGKWLQVNGEAIYGSTTWIKQAEKKDVFLRRIDPEINFDWVRNSAGKPIAEDAFTAKWKGYIQAPLTGKYVFEAEVDDAIRVWINDELVIDKWSREEEASADGNVMTNLDYSLEKGEIHLEANKKYSIKVDYYESELNARARLFWSSDNLKRTIVLQENLFTSKDKVTGDGLNVTYQSKAIWLCYTKKGDAVYITYFDWPGKELVIDFPSLNEGTVITLLGREGELDYSYENEQLTIDLSEIYHNDLPCDYAWTIKLKQN